MHRILCVLLLGATGPGLAADQLPSWNDSPTKAAVLDFVRNVTADGTEGFVPASERIAVFDMMERCGQKILCLFRLPTCLT